MTYTPSQLAAITNVRLPLRAEPMMGKITDATVGVSQSGNEQVILSLTPMDNNQPLTGLTIKHYISKVSDTLADAAANGDPKANQSLGWTKKKAYQFFRATDPEFPTFAEKVGNGVYSDGTKNLTYEEYKAHNKNVDAYIFDRLASLDEKNVKTVVGKPVFFCPQKVDSEKGQFVNWIAGELKDGTEYLKTDLVDREAQQRLIESALNDAADVVDAAQGSA